MNLLFDFIVDKANRTIHIQREFAAGIDLVWDAFTKAELLDRWSAPKPWRARTKEMDFREGGRWLYAMVSPENTSHWSLVEFIKVQPKSLFSGKNSFCDEHGSPLNNLYSLTTNTFKAQEEKTTVYIEKKFSDLSGLEKLVAMGFREGMAMAFGNLDEYLPEFGKNV